MRAWFTPPTKGPPRSSLTLSCAMAASIELKDRFRGSLLGLAVGDAVGTTVDNMPRGSFPPVTDMVGGGRFSLLAGQVSLSETTAVYVLYPYIQFLIVYLLRKTL